MPRRVEPKRDIIVNISEESVREALQMWIKTYHGIQIETSTIEYDYDSETKQVKQVRALKRQARKTPDVPNAAKTETVVAELVCPPNSQNADHDVGSNQEP